MKNIVLSLILFLSCAAAQADDGLSPKIIYSLGQTVSGVVQCVLDSNLPETDTTVFFDPYIKNGDIHGDGAGDQNALHWTLQSDKTLLYTPPPPPPPPPDVSGFEGAIFGDPTIPVLTTVNLVPFKSTVEQYSLTNPPALQSIWAAMIAVYGSSGWLAGNCSDGMPIITKIQNYAATYRVPLLP